MTYDNGVFALYGLIIPFAIIALLIIVLALFCRTAAKKLHELSAERGYGKTKVGLINISLILSFFALFMLMLLALFELGIKDVEYPASVMSRRERPTMITTGQISEIQPGPDFPSYYDSEKGGFYPALFCTVNGEKFYVISGDFELGQWVEFTWTTELRTVEAWRSLSQAEAEASVAGTLSLPAEEPSPESMPHYTVYLWVHRISFGLFLILVFAQYPLGRLLSRSFEKRDAKYKNGLRPQYAGVLVAVTPFVLIGGILVGQSSKSGLFVLVLALALLAWFIHMGRRSSLRFDGNSVMYTERPGKEMIYRASDIACVTWDDGFRLNGLKGRMAPKRRILSMRSLVIRLHTGKELAFDQMFYWGLGDMYQRLSQWLLAYQSAEEAKE